MILYPVVGQEPSMSTIADDLSPQPVVINWDTGSSWLPNPRSVWSQDLGIMISPGFSSSSYDYSDKNAVYTRTFDGQDDAFFWGKLLGISPSGTKILVDDDTIIDLRNNKIMELAWYMNYDLERSPRLYWTSDETRVYRCCYYFADLTSGRSYSFDMTDLRRIDGKPGPSSILPHAYGEWVRNDTYFLMEWSWIDDGDIRYLPMFSPAEKKYYDVREMAGISEDWSCQQTVVSPDGTYIWMTGWGEKEEGSYLVNLFTFESHYFPGKEYLNIDWSPNGKFAWLYNSDPTNGAEEYSILSVTDHTIRPLPVKARPESGYWWHPTKDVIVYLSEDQHLILLDVSIRIVQELRLYFDLRNLVWSPNGEKIGFAANDGTLWQVGYPKLDNLKRITPPYYKIDHLQWSPDSTSIAFTSGPDIYIVDTVK